MESTLNELDVIFMTDTELKALMIQHARPVDVPDCVVRASLTRESYLNSDAWEEGWFFPEQLAEQIIRIGKEVGWDITFGECKDFGAKYDGVWRYGIHMRRLP